MILSSFSRVIRLQIHTVSNIFHLCVSVVSCRFTTPAPMDTMKLLSCCWRWHEHSFDGECSQGVPIYRLTYDSHKLTCHRSHSSNPYAFLCSTGPAWTPWTSGSSPPCTRRHPRTALRSARCFWATVPTPPCSTVTARAPWTWHPPLSSRRGSHVSGQLLFAFSTALFRQIRTEYWRGFNYETALAIFGQRTRAQRHLKMWSVFFLSFFGDWLCGFI